MAAKKPKGRPAHKPTQALRERVIRGKGFGESNENLAKALGITVNTLKKYYAEELEAGQYETKDIVAKAAMQLVSEGDKSVIIFLLKALWGMSDRPEDNRTGAVRDLQRIQAIIIPKSDNDSDNK